MNIYELGDQSVSTSFNGNLQSIVRLCPAYYHYLLTQSICQKRMSPIVCYYYPCVLLEIIVTISYGPSWRSASRAESPKAAVK